MGIARFPGYCLAEHCKLHCHNMLFVVSCLSVDRVLLKTFAVSLRDNVCLPAALRAAQSASYLSYSEADFEVFCPVGATRWTGGVKSCTEASMLTFTPIGPTIRV